MSLRRQLKGIKEAWILYGEKGNKLIDFAKVNEVKRVAKDVLQAVYPKPPYIKEGPDFETLHIVTIGADNDFVNKLENTYFKEVKSYRKCVM